MITVPPIQSLNNIMIEENNNDVEQQVNIAAHPQHSPVLDSPLSQPPTPVRCDFTHTSATNFIKSVRLGLNSNLICIYEQEPFVVQLRHLNQANELQRINLTLREEINGKLQSRQVLAEDMATDTGILGEIRLQTVPYDCVEIEPNLWMVSNKAMPPRIYRRSISACRLEHTGSFHNKKKNSEQYLAPIQISTHPNRKGYALGGGSRFLCSYDLQKIVQDQMYPAYDKTNISALHLLNENVALVGTFEGVIQLLDLRQVKERGSAQTKMRPHVDAVMSFATTPMNPNIYASSARKDDFIYLWDCRYDSKGSTYTHELVQPKYGNQRISLAFSGDGKTLYTGSQKSQIIGWEYDSQSRTKRWGMGTDLVVNSVVYHQPDDTLIFSTGSRRFEQTGDEEKMLDEAEIKKNSNVLAAIKLNHSENVEVEAHFH